MAKKKGFIIKAATELEYYSYRNSYADAKLKNYHVCAILEFMATVFFFL